MSAVVAVLAGGRGRRMGGSKPLATLAGAPLVARPLAAATAAGLPAAVVAKRGTRLPDGLGAPVWEEPDTPVHPLVGIVCALERAGGPVIAVGCDMPFVTGALLARLAAGPEGAVRARGRVAPLPARYEPEWLPDLRAALDEQAPLRATLEARRPLVLGDDELAALGDPGRLLASVNTRAELAAAERA